MAGLYTHFSITVLYLCYTKYSGQGLRPFDQESKILDLGSITRYIKTMSIPSCSYPQSKPLDGESVRALPVCLFCGRDGAASKLTPDSIGCENTVLKASKNRQQRAHKAERWARHLRPRLWGWKRQYIVSFCELFGPLSGLSWVLTELWHCFIGKPYACRQCLLSPSHYFVNQPLSETVA